FAGAQHYRGLPFPPSLIYVDLASYSAFPSNSLAGDVTTAARLAHTSSEETSFFGWPMVLVVLVLAGWLCLRKVTVARATATTRVPVPPTFITAGHWRQYVPAGRTLVTVPTTSSFFLDGMRWASATNLEFAIPRGYFLGPNSNPSSPPLYGAVPTWTSIVLDQVALTGSARPKQDGDDALFLHDLKMWHAAILVLSDQQANAPALLTTVEQFLGPPQL